MTTGTSSDLWDQPPGERWYMVRAGAGAPNEAAEILIYDEINPIYGISASDFIADLAKIDSKEITVRINSPGGAMFDGIAILNALRGHDARVTTIVDGLAASIAGVIAMGGDEVVMMPNSTFMVHNAWDIVIGNADELQKAADTLRQFSANLASIYAEKAGGTVADWQAIMDAETWYTADEAVTAGLADRVLRTSSKAPSYARALFDLSKFRYAGRGNAPDPVIARAHKTVPTQVKPGKEPAVATSTEAEADRLIDQAIRERKIAASQRAAWRSRFQQDFTGYKALLGQITPGIELHLEPNARATSRPPAAYDADMADVYAKVIGKSLYDSPSPARPRATRDSSTGTGGVRADVITNDELNAMIEADPDLHRAAWKMGVRDGLTKPAEQYTYWENPDRPHHNEAGQWVEPARDRRIAELDKLAAQDRIRQEEQKERDIEGRAALREAKAKWSL